jgi:phosphoribosylanthranilate isomerase
MTWVKVCGLTTRRDVLTAVAAGADAVGFNTIPASPRRVDIEAIGELAAGVGIATFLLTVDLMPDEILDAADLTGVTGIQPYGHHAAEAAIAAVAAGLDVLVPLRPSDGQTARDAPAGTRPLFDSGGPGLGGTGAVFDWDLVASGGAEFVLAGGLGPDNVADAIRAVRPWGVDAASRLEAGPGVKDPGKVAAFIERAKSA